MTKTNPFMLILKGAPLLAVACALGLLGAASHAEAKKVGAALAANIGGAVFDDWTACTNNSPLFGHAQGFNSSNTVVCSVATRGITKFADCSGVAVRHRSLLRAGASTFAISATTTTWDVSQTSFFTLPVSRAGEGCQVRQMQFASVGQL